MKLNLFLLVVAELLLMDKGKISYGQLIPIYNDESDFNNNMVSEQKDRSFTSQELREIYGLAKNISHSKGRVIQSKEGDPEYRRSFIQKVIRETKFEALKLWFTKHINTSKEYSVSDLQELEYLVHQYETGIDFAKLGGLEFLLPLINEKDPQISSAALSVLSAAMQGNPTVKNYAEHANILDYILNTLTGTHCRSSTTSLYTLSSYIRNNPIPQLKFFQQNGLNILADILKSRKKCMRAKLKVLDLLYDLSSEIYEDPMTAYENKNQLVRLRRALGIGFLNSNLCKIIPKYLSYEDIVIQEKTVNALNSVAKYVCSEEFKKPHIIKIVEKFLHKYDYRQAYYFLMNSESHWRRLIVLDALEDLLLSMRMQKHNVNNNFGLQRTYTVL